LFQVTSERQEHERRCICIKPTFIQHAKTTRILIRCLGSKGVFLSKARRCRTAGAGADWCKLMT